jgi:colanic acid biosynthesis protein WcaH
MIIEKKLYRQIQESMPIPCIDLIVVNEVGEILLAKRNNEPARGQWWFPGGRVYYLEARLDAAVRKLREECGLEAVQLEEMGTFDVIVEDLKMVRSLHAITTVFVVKVKSTIAVTLDAQNSEAKWHLPSYWLRYKLNPFVKQVLAIYSKKRNENRYMSSDCLNE